MFAIKTYISIFIFNMCSKINNRSGLKFKGSSLNTKEKVFFIKLLRELEGTTNINERSWDKDSHTLEVLVSYKGSTDEFKEIMFMEMWENPLFDYFEEAKSKGSTIYLQLN